MLTVTDIVKRFGTADVLRGVSAEVERGEVVAVIGRSGSGKSTFLRCLNHLEEIDGGTIEVEGETMASTDAAGVVHYA
ncbi:MAG: ATP-binding cassette domain-containing protein, partial [Oscillospiraceae bacterium]|nr:ATP-binding cassette domain-containing protein [Oscillospiraceae bacterium]